MPEAYRRGVRATTRSFAFCSTIALAAVHGQAIAQNADSASAVGIEDIIVTAQKRSENLQDVPIAVSAFSADTLRAANVTGVFELTTVTPTLRFSFAGPSGAPFLRGVGSDQTFPGAEAEVQTYIDNVYYGSGGTAFFKFNNIARVEVDKGPQGTLFGRNATGGVIQIFTRDPTDEPTVDAAIGYGNYDLKEGDLYASTGIGENLAADISVHYEDHDGWGRNITLNRQAFAANSVGVRSKWLFEPSSDSRLTLILDYGRNRSDFGTAFVVAGAYWRASLSSPAPGFLGQFTTAGDTRSYAVLTHHGASIKGETRLGDLSFVSISAYRTTKSEGYLDGDGTAAPALAATDLRTEEQASQEFQLLSPSDARLKWILGAYLYYNKSKADPSRLSGSTFAAFGANSIDFFSAMTTKSIAGFGQASYDLGDATHVTAGLRYTHDHRHQSANAVFNYPAGPGAGPPFLGIGVNNFPNAAFDALTGKFTIAQDLSDDVMAYIGYSRGFKSGTFNNLIVFRNPEPALEPEHIDAFEGGIKADLLDRRVRLNLSAFYYKYKNLQINVYQNFNIALQNAASSTIKGLEGDAQIAISRTTRLSGAFAWLDARYDRFTNAPLYTINPINSLNPANFGFGGAIIGTADASGRRMPQAPKFSGNVAIDQKLETGFGDIDLNATMAFQSRIYFTPDNLFSQRPYATLSSSAKWTSRDGSWDISLWGRNLTNVKSFSALTVSSFLVAGIPNEPRSYGARLGVHF